MNKEVHIQIFVLIVGKTKTVTVRFAHHQDFVLQMYAIVRKGASIDLK